MKIEDAFAKNLLSWQRREIATNIVIDFKWADIVSENLSEYGGWIEDTPDVDVVDVNVRDEGIEVEVELAWVENQDTGCPQMPVGHAHSGKMLLCLLEYGDWKIVKFIEDESQTPNDYY